MQTVNLAIAADANIEYREDGTLVVRPNTSKEYGDWGARRTTPMHPNRPDNYARYQVPGTHHHLALLGGILGGCRLSQIAVMSHTAKEMLINGDLVDIEFTADKDVVCLVANDYIINTTIIGPHRQLRLPVPDGVEIVILRYSDGWHRIDYKISRKSEKVTPLSPADIAIAILNGTSDSVLPNRPNTPRGELLCVNDACVLTSKLDALIVVADRRGVRSITSVEDGGCAVYAAVGNTITEIYVDDSGTVVNDYVAVARLTPTPMEQLQAYIKDNIGKRVNVTLSVDEIRVKYDAFLSEHGYALTSVGITSAGKYIWASDKPIALMCRDFKTDTIYIAPWSSDVLDSNILYLADAITGVVSDLDVLNGILSSGGRCDDCHRAATNVKVEERRYVPFIEYYKSLNVDPYRIDTTWSATKFRDMHGANLSAVNNLMLVTSSGVCPWVGTTYALEERLMLSYLTADGQLLIGRYTTLSKNDYMEAIKAITGMDYDVSVLDRLFGTSNGVPVNTPTSNPD